MSEAAPQRCSYKKVFWKYTAKFRYKFDTIFKVYDLTLLIDGKELK